MALSTSRGSIVGDLLSYGEEAAADWAWEAPPETLEEILTVAQWLLYYGPSMPSGASMLISKAVALAGVYVHESAPRDLLRKRRDLKGAQSSPHLRTARAGERFVGTPGYDAVGMDARAYWGRQGAGTP